MGVVYFFVGVAGGTCGDGTDGDAGTLAGMPLVPGVLVGGTADGMPFPGNGLLVLTASPHAVMSANTTNTATPATNRTKLE
jgi:hypothetical protein